MDKIHGLTRSLVRDTNQSVWTVRLVDDSGTTLSESRLGRGGFAFILIVVVLVAGVSIALLFRLPSSLEEGRSLDDQLTRIRTSAEDITASVSSVMRAAELLSWAGMDPNPSVPPSDSTLSLLDLGVEGPSEGLPRAARELVQLSSELRSLTYDLQSAQGAYEGLADVLDLVPNLWPIQSGLGKVSFEFGPAIHPFTGTWYMHRGIDIAARPGLSILAMARGTVTKVERDTNNFGLQVVVQHEYGFETRYAHLGDALVGRGDEVEAGSIIGTLGSSGLVTGPALHLEILIGQELVDPAAFLKMTNEFARRALQRGS